MDNLINVKIPKQKNINFSKGIFYKPEKKIKISKIFDIFRNLLVAAHWYKSTERNPCICRRHERQKVRKDEIYY